MKNFFVTFRSKGKNLELYLGCAFTLTSYNLASQEATASVPRSNESRRIRMKEDSKNDDKNSHSESFGCKYVTRSYLTVLSVAHSITQPSGRDRPFDSTGRSRREWVERRGREGDGREGNAESVKVVRKSDYRNRFPVWRLLTGMVDTLFSTSLHIRISFGDSPLSFCLFPSLSLLSFSMSSRSRGSTIDDEIRVYITSRFLPPGSIHRAARWECWNRRGGLDATLLYRPAPPPPFVFLRRPPSRCRRVLPAFIRAILYLPTFHSPRGPTARFLPFLKHACVHCTYFTPANIINRQFLIWIISAIISLQKYNNYRFISLTCKNMSYFYNVHFF